MNRAERNECSGGSVGNTTSFSPLPSLGPKTFEIISSGLSCCVDDGAAGRSPSGRPSSVPFHKTSGIGSPRGGPVILVSGYIMACRRCFTSILDIEVRKPSVDFTAHSGFVSILFPAGAAAKAVSLSKPFSALSNPSSIRPAQAWTGLPAARAEGAPPYPGFQQKHFALILDLNLNP